MQFIDSVAMMGARLRAKRLASDLELTSSSGSLPVQPVISGLGQFLPLATGSLLAPQLAVLASEAAAKSLPEGGQTEVGTNK